MQKHGGNLTQLKADLGLPDRSYHDFSANINPYGLPEVFRDLIQTQVDQVMHYPDFTYTALRKALAAYYKVDCDLVVVGNGAEALIHQVMPLLPEQIVLVHPTFSEYGRAAHLYHKEICTYFLPADRYFGLEVEDLLAFVGHQEGFGTSPSLASKTAHKSPYRGAVFLCQPNNPTGRLYSRTSMEALADGLMQLDYYLVLDESFMDFVADPAEHTMLDRVGNHPNVIIIQSLTKFYAIPGLRLGWGLVNNPQLKAALEARLGVWPINTFADECGQAIGELDAYRSASRIYLEREKRRLKTALASYPALRLYSTATNFLFLQSGHPHFFEALLHQGIVIRSCNNFPGLDRTYFRLAVRRHEENTALIAALAALDWPSGSALGPEGVL